MSDQPILNHISAFLDYCRSEGLKNNTQKNYQRYLNKFAAWLTSRKLEGLLPHQLNALHIAEYKLHLSIPHNSLNERVLEKSTQKYYLIALRALLSYFSVKGIVSILPDKIALPKADKGAKNPHYPNSGQLNSLFTLSSAENPIQLRNKAILHTIISTGFKISQITSLDKNSISSLPKEATIHIKKYLETRNDKEEENIIKISN